jgi:hypothetical protein
MRCEIPMAVSIETGLLELYAMKSGRWLSVFLRNINLCLKELSTSYTCHYIPEDHSPNTSLILLKDLIARFLKIIF